MTVRVEVIKRYITDSLYPFCTLISMTCKVKVGKKEESDTKEQQLPSLVIVYFVPPSEKEGQAAPNCFRSV